MSKQAVYSELDSTVLRIDIDGVSIEDVVTEHGLFQAVEIPGEHWLNVEGKPRVPKLVLMVACPEFEDVEVACVAEMGAEVDECDLIPCPCRTQYREEGSWGDMSEFCLDEETYAADQYYPGKFVDVLRVGRIRDQKVVWLGVYPVQYNGLKRSLELHSRVRVALRYSGSAPSRAVNGTGPFEDICQRLLLGYTGGGSAGSVPILRSGGGSVVWADSLVDCTRNNTDYLIIAGDRFCRDDTADVVESFADHKAASSGFNVSIINVEDILGGIAIDADAADDSIKQFIQDLYDDGSAAHWWDGHLGFVLLIGDYKTPADSIVMPIHLFDNARGDSVAWRASDNWYACVGGDSVYPALMIGRVSVDDSLELEAVLGKIKSYEPLPDTAAWTRSILLTAGTAGPDSAGDRRDVNTSFAKIQSVLPSDVSVTTVRGDSMCNYGCGGTPDVLKDIHTSEFNEGKAFVHYAVHSDGCKMGWHVPRSFSYEWIDGLSNDDRLCIFTSFSCSMARFDTDSTCGGGPGEPNDCIGEKFLNTAEKGAVAVIGNTAEGDTYQISRGMASWFYEPVFKWNVPLLGEAYVEMIFRVDPYNNEWIERLVILGDPALRLRYRDSGEDKWDLCVKRDSEVMDFNPRIDSLPAPDSTTVTAVVRNAGGVGLNIPPADPPLEVEFWVSITNDSMKYLGMDSIRTLEAWDTTSVGISFAVRDSLSMGLHQFKITIDTEGCYADSEALQENNIDSLYAYVGSPPSTGEVPSSTSDRPTFGYLESSAGSWDYFMLIPCKDSHLYAYNSNGSIPIWSFSAVDGDLFSPAVLDSAGSRREIVTSQHKIWCIDGFEDGSGQQIRWVRDLGASVTVLTAPCIADFDGDGDLDVAIGARTSTGADTGLVYRVRGEDGSDISSATTLLDTLPSCALAAVDLDGDSKCDVVVGTNKNKLVAIAGSSGVHLATGIKVAHSSVDRDVTGVVVGDLDFDGSPEIVACAMQYVAVFSGDTTLRRMGRRSIGTYPIAGLALGDVLERSDTLALEIVAAGVEGAGGSPDIGVAVLSFQTDPDTSVILQRVFAEDLGTGFRSVCSPLVANLHPEEGSEVCFMATAPDSEASLWVWNPESDIEVGFFSGISGPVDGAVICDFENDHEPEIMFAANGDRSVWTVSQGPCARRADWPTVSGDERGRNLYAVTLKDTLPHRNSRLWGRYVIASDVTVGAGDTLTISPGVRIQFVPSDTAPPPSIDCYEGFVIAQGREDAPIILRSASPSPTPHDWGALTLQTGADHILEHVVIEHATCGLMIGRDPDLPPVCPGGSGGEITVRSCEFRHNQSYGICASDGMKMDDIVIESCLFSNNGVGGLAIPYGNVVVRSSMFYKDDDAPGNGPAFYAVYLGNEAICEGDSAFLTCAVRDNHFSAGSNLDPDSSFWDYAIYLIGVSAVDTVLIRNNRMDSFLQSGITVSSLRTAAIIDWNYIESGIPGYAYSGMRFLESGVGTTAPEVRNNIVYQTKYGVISDMDPPPILGDVALFDGNNDLVADSILVKNYAVTTLKAERCWWGTDPPATSKIVGNVDYDPWRSVGQSGVEDQRDPEERLRFNLLPSYPNPVVVGTVGIRFSVPRKCVADLEVFNVLGQKVRTLHSGELEPGQHEVFWDITNDRRQRVGPGVYFYRFTSREYEKCRKIVVLN